ncbi:MAG: hypothetical protein ACR2Q4_24260 [Geminicoccaceae bacterium]
MLMNAQSYVSVDTDDFDSGVEIRDFSDLVLTPAANQTAASWTVVRRGGQLMVVFTSSPRPMVAQALLDEGVQIGLALAPGELNNVSGLDQFSYVHVSMARNAALVQKQAITDLASNGWVVDDSSLWAPDLDGLQDFENPAYSWKNLKVLA